MTLDPKLVAEYRKLRTPDFSGDFVFISPARFALVNARNNVELRELERSGVLAFEDADYRGDVDRPDEDATIRVLFIPDDDASTVLDFDCCSASDTSRRYGTFDSSERVIRCDCEIDRSTNSHASPRARLLKHNGTDYHVSLEEAETGRDCRYGQPCKHKCDQARRMEMDGVYGMRSQWRDPETDEWIGADDVWGFVGTDDARDSGYVPDLVHAALEALAAREEQIADAGALVDTRSI